MQIRNIVREDIPDLKNILDNCELFPSEYLEDMIGGYLYDKETEEIWFAVEKENGLVSFAFCAPMKFTEGTYNLYAIGVHNDHQGKGIGKKMMAHLEALLKSQGHRILIVETSGTEALALTREFYLKCNYRQEASIQDFWEDGDDKVIFWKKL